MSRLDDIQTALKPLKKSEKIEKHFYEWAKQTMFLLAVITSERSERSSYEQSYMIRPVDIQSALKPLKKSEKI